MQHLKWKYTISDRPRKLQLLQEHAYRRRRHKQKNKMMNKKLLQLGKPFPRVEEVIEPWATWRQLTISILNSQPAVYNACDAAYSQITTSNPWVSYLLPRLIPVATHTHQPIGFLIKWAQEHRKLSRNHRDITKILYFYSFNHISFNSQLFLMFLGLFWSWLVWLQLPKPEPINTLTHDLQECDVPLHLPNNYKNKNIQFVC